MRCPHCATFPSSVIKTERPLDEGLAYGDVKRRTRKCRQCQANFTTFEIQESLFRTVAPKADAGEIKPPKTPKTPEERKLSRQPLTFGSKAQRPK